MNKKVIGAFAIILVIFAVIAILPRLKNGKSDDNKQASQNNQIFSNQKSLSNVVVMPEKDMVQVYLFHATQRCTTCIAIGQLAGETVDEFFQPELQEGKIEFREINIDLPENKALAEKFQASGSALYTNNYKGGKNNITEDTKVWRLTDDETGFKNYLKGELDKLLGK